MARDRKAKAEEDRHVGFRWLAREAGLHGEAEAEAVFRTVSRALSRRIGPEETRHLASHMPLGLRDVWHEETGDVIDASRFDLDQLVSDVQDELRILDPLDARWLVQIVFAWLRHLAPEERADVAARLPKDIRDLWNHATLAEIAVADRHTLRAP